MIAEERERDMSSIEQALQSYLRQEYSYDVLRDYNQEQAAIQRLIYTATDYAMKHGINISDSDAERLAREAVETFKANWKGKVQGEDDRGHRFGKSKYL